MRDGTHYQRSDDRALSDALDMGQEEEREHTSDGNKGDVKVHLHPAEVMPQPFGYHPDNKLSRDHSYVGFDLQAYAHAQQKAAPERCHAVAWL